MLACLSVEMGSGCVEEKLAQLSRRLSAKVTIAGDKVEGHMLFPVGPFGSLACGSCVCAHAHKWEYRERMQSTFFV